MTRARVRTERVDYPTLWDFAGYGTLSGTPHSDLKNCPDFWIYWGIQIEFGKGIGRVSSIADLSAGDARITRPIAEHSGVEPILGDVAPGYPIQGELTDTVRDISAVELFVCTNTLEHLDDPDGDLRLIRSKADKLFASGSLDEHAEPSGDHYWSWDRGDLEQMLESAGWRVSAYCELDMTPYWYPHCKFGMWACR